MITSRPSSDDAPQSGLPEEHQRLNEVFQSLLNCASTGDWRSCDQTWDGFCEALLKHLELEETAFFPRFMEEGVRERRATQELLLDHDEIRRQLHELGLSIQLHTIRAETIATFISAMRQHAKKEDELFHPWLVRDRQNAKKAD